MIRPYPISLLFPYTTLFRSKHSVPRFFVPEHGTMFTLALVRFPPTATKEIQYLNAKGARVNIRSEERFSRNAETDLVCRLLLEKKNRCRHPRRGAVELGHRL